MLHPRLWLLLLGIGSAVACTARIGDSTPGPGGSDGPPAGPDAGVAPRELPPFAPAPAALHRLTVREYGNTLLALFGPEVPIPADLEVDTPLYGFSTVGARSLTIGPRAAEQFEAAALAVAGWAFGDRGRAQALVGCTPAGPADPCAVGFIERFARRAYRRPLEAEERAALVAAAESLAARFQDPWKGLELVVAALLESPHFLYRVEMGVADGPGGARRYTGLEMATRLSYFLWAAPPDEALLDLAERGELDTAEGVGRQARRMLDDPRSGPALLRFFTEHLRLERLESMSKSAALFPQMSPTLLSSMRQELERMLERVALSPGRDFREVFTTRETFVNAELARLYNLPAVVDVGFVPVELPAGGPRAGMLTTGAFLALNAHETVTSPTFRGRFIRQSLLCQDIPPPPPGQSTELPPPDPNQGPETLRQRLERLHFKNATCAACHLRMDPLGFTFEIFDALGAYRTTDNGLPVDPRGELDGVRVRDARGLSAALAERDDVAACLARMTYRYAAGHLETDGEARTLAGLAKAFEESGHSFRELALAVVTSDGFRLAAAEE